MSGRNPAQQKGNIMKKEADGIISCFTGTPLEAIHPYKDSVIVHSSDFSAGIERAYQVHSEIVRAFPNNLVISVPNTDSIACLDKHSTIEFLQSMISMIQGKEML